MPTEKMEELKEISLMKQILRIMRMHQISKTASDLKTKEQFHSFHEQALNALMKLHPHATKHIMNTMGN